MQIPLGLRDAPSGARADIHVDAPHGTPFGDVADALLGLVAPEGAPGPLSVGGQAVTAHSPLGVPPLVDGALLGLHAPSEPPVRTDRPTIEVVGGPAAGGSFPLTSAHHTLGRVGLLALDDPDVRRTHCRLPLPPAAAQVFDLGAPQRPSGTGGRVTAHRRSRSRG